MKPLLVDYINHFQIISSYLIFGRIGNWVSYCQSGVYYQDYQLILPITNFAINTYDALRLR